MISITITFANVVVIVGVLYAVLDGSENMFSI